jgi:tetratricopeptide (TPR) repeat protein
MGSLPVSLALLLTGAFCFPVLCLAQAEIHVYAGHNKEAAGLTNEGSSFVQAGKADDAIAPLNRAIELDREMWPAYLARAKAFVTQRKYQRALRDLDEAVRLKPDFFQIYLVRGAAHIGLHQYRLSLQDLNQAIRLKPNNAQVHALRAAACVFLNDSAGALGEANIALSQSNAIKNKAPLLNLRAWICATSTNRTLRNGRQALADARQVSKMIGNKNPGALDTLAAAYAETGDFASAVLVQREAISIGNTSNETTMLLRKHLASFERHEPIREDFSRFASDDLMKAE